VSSKINPPLRYEHVPERGDVIWLDFDPQLGNGQAKRRPALVLSADQYNRLTGLAVFCPITSKIKGFPWEVSIPVGLPISGVVLSDQVKNLDWRARKAEFIGKVPTSTLEEVIQTFLTLFEET
jgi:mRNA interferase MazF